MKNGDLAISVCIDDEDARDTLIELAVRRRQEVEALASQMLCAHLREPEVETSLTHIRRRQRRARGGALGASLFYVGLAAGVVGVFVWRRSQFFGFPGWLAAVGCVAAGAEMGYTVWEKRKRPLRWRVAPQG